VFSGLDGGAGPGVKARIPSGCSKRLYVPSGDYRYWMCIIAAGNQAGN